MSSYNELIPGKVYIGGAAAAEEVAEKEHVDVIYDLRAEAAEKGELSTPQSVSLPLKEDEGGQADSIKQVAQQIVSDFDEGKSVFFHCQGGSGRTGTIAAAVLLEMGRANTVEDAIQQVQSVRDSVKVKPEFSNALSELYEK